MGIMEKMRNSTASILWILIFSFGVLWVLADTQVFDALAVGPQNLGEVNGDPITLEEYNNRVSYYTDQFNEQAGPGESMTPEVRSMYENQAWEDLVNSRLLQQEMNRMGISVTDQELIEMITGDNPDPFIRQQFAQEDGTIDRIALQAAIEAPENSQAWIMIEQQLRENRRQQKMTNFISSALRVSSMEINNEFVQDNSFADIRYLRFPYSEISDDEVSFTDSDLRNYYENNSSQYRQEEMYRFRYVSWEKTPTAQDTTATVQEIEDLREPFANAVNDSLFTIRYQSAVPFDGDFKNEDEITEDYRPVVDLEVGEVSEVIMIDGDPHVFKKIEERGEDIKFAVLSYRVVADPVGTIDRIAESADEFEFYASSDGFETEAERRDMEIQETTATKGNPFIAGLGQSQQILTVLENLREGRISEPIETNDRFLVIQLVERTPEGVRPFNEVRNQVENSVRNEIRREIALERVQEIIDSNGDLESLADRAEKEIQTARDIAMGTNNIPDAGREISVIGAIFNMEAGETSGAIPGNNAVFVVHVDAIDIATPSQMDAQQRQRIQQRLEQEKFMAFNQVFVDRLKENAQITDNRSEILR